MIAMMEARIPGTAGMLLRGRAMEPDLDDNL
jgi:hypothetical protein